MEITKMSVHKKIIRIMYSNIDPFYSSDIDKLKGYILCLNAEGLITDSTYDRYRKLFINVGEKGLKSEK